MDKYERYPKPTVGALIVNPEGKILLIKSHKWNHKYQVAGGHIEPGESAKDALKREAKEETGLNVSNIKFLQYQDFLFGKEYYKKRHFLFLDFSCKSKSSKVVLNEEGQAYVWKKPKEALRMNLNSYTRKTIKKYLEKNETKN